MAVQCVELFSEQGGALNTPMITLRFPTPSPILSPATTVSSFVSFRVKGSWRIRPVLVLSQRGTYFNGWARLVRRGLAFVVPPFLAAPFGLGAPGWAAVSLS